MSALMVPPEWKALAQLRREGIEGIRKNGWEDGIKRLLTDLYPDNAHFLYELLQNAEDTRATEVTFRLHPDRLEFSHNGRRLFNLDDVEAITGIGISPKCDDPTSIGKFGVGFKAVFAYTATPAIRSGAFAFTIRDMVVPEWGRTTQPVGAITDFSIPFDHPRKGVQQACREIARGLEAMAGHTLLFLNHIRKISYTLPDGRQGHLERQEEKDGVVHIRFQAPGQEPVLAHWLRFNEQVQVEDENGKAEDCSIAVAFALEPAEEDTGRRKPGMRIVPVDRGQVFIFFPTDKEVSNLKFHLHAPFASTVARDSVRDCPPNHVLRDHLAELVVASMEKIKAMGALTIPFLAALPNERDNVPAFYQPIRQRLVEAFQKEDLTPTRTGGHRGSESLYRGPSRIQETIRDEDLSLLTGYAVPLWAANPPQQNQREDLFLDSLKIETWDWTDLESAMDNLAFDDEVRERFLLHVHAKPDAWLLKFYSLLGEAALAHGASFSLMDMPLVRVSVDAVDQHLHPKEVFFPPPGGQTLPGVRLVKPETLFIPRAKEPMQQAVEFLTHIGVRQYTERTELDLLIQRITNRAGDIDDDYFPTLAKLVEHYKLAPQSVDFLRSQNFLLVDQGESLLWQPPSSVCLAAPYRSTQLDRFESIHGRKPLADIYAEDLDPACLQAFLDMVAHLGAVDGLYIIRTSADNNPQQRILRADYLRPRVKFTSTGTDEDYRINYLSSYLATKTPEAGLLIWNALLAGTPRMALARYAPNQSYPIREQPSQVVAALRGAAWIPDRSSTLRTPAAMTAEDLPPEFRYDPNHALLKAIEFGKEAELRSSEHRLKEVAAKGLGYASLQEQQESLEITRILKGRGMSARDILRLLPDETPDLPGARLRNPEQRRRSVLDQRANAPEKELVRRERTVDPNANEEKAESKAYLRAKYTNPEGQMVCQCCSREMPFKIRKEYYFEAVQCIRGKERHYYENRLALCPVCAAMYQHALQSSQDEIQKAIVDAVPGPDATSVTIPVRMADRDEELRFVTTHWFDLKTVLSG